MAAQPLNQNDWSTGLFDCLGDIPLAAEVYLFGCCAIARQWKAAHEGVQDTLDPILCCAACCCGNVMNVINRFRVIDKYNIRENWFVTALIGFYLGQLSTCQTHKELTVQGCFPGGFIAKPQEYTKMN